MKFLSSLLLTLFATALVQAAPIPNHGDSSLQLKSSAQNAVQRAHSSHTLKHLHSHESLTNDGDSNEDLQDRSFDEHEFALVARDREDQFKEHRHASKEHSHPHLDGSVNHAHKSHLEARWHPADIKVKVQNAWTALKDKIRGPKRVRPTTGSAGLRRRELEARWHPADIKVKVQNAWTKIKNAVLGPKQVRPRDLNDELDARSFFEEEEY